MIKDSLKKFGKLMAIAVVTLTAIITPVQVFASSNIVQPAENRADDKLDLNTTSPVGELVNIIILDINSKLLVSKLEDSLAPYKYPRDTTNINIK
ncbi:hypothetical protein BMT55_15070 [Listeria newyorkensis]|uniref:Uncharacterized protein n=1 Tax=Listeria newyorkensis TaxID=1497681 RepID=A0ABX4XJT7_9LIST|nr:hypothetical protein [Listeria newyorkensis]KGL37884.1 hypothetical protein EP58_16795 [Listeria newyorkensis]PNP88394.1 hypothetical protein BMT55_15070 [Listeria newyorkensis]WAO20496.1 hypothetical protein OTR81_09265 [Listeria newyorkensis]SQC56677.1 Uncharacterised protein [Listeria newyorkensis]